MPIDLTNPIPRPRFARIELAFFGARPKERTIILVFGFYAEDGTRIGEERFELNDDSTPSFADFVQGVASSRTFKRETEEFYKALKMLDGSVS